MININLKHIYILITVGLFIILMQYLNNRGNVYKTYTLTYVVFYPTYNDTVTVSNNKGYAFYSIAGTNFIREEGSTFGTLIYSGSAPCKALSYTEYPTNDE